jgi:hypothetical protein
MNILADIDLRERFPHVVEIKMIKRKYSQVLDYWKISFACIKCHAHGHMVNNSPHSVGKWEWFKVVKHPLDLRKLKKIDISCKIESRNKYV